MRCTYCLRFFAYTNGLHSTYEIRLNTPREHSQFGKLFHAIPESIKRDFINIQRGLAKFVKAAGGGLYRIAENPDYVTIDSDSENNEVILRAQSDSDTKGDPGVIFPGLNFPLNNHKGGCNFHAVSESLARGWNGISPNITDSINCSIYVTSFSIAGGTGAGSAPIICQKSKEKKDSNSICHFMGIGVLPKSDECYIEGERALTMPDYEKFNTGRFFVSAYGRRIPKSMNSIWLFSNDALRFLHQSQTAKNSLEDEGGEMEMNLSVVNFLIAQSLTMLANSSSKVTSADTNLDPRELNDFLDGQPFVSAMSRRRVGKDNHVFAVKGLLLGALTNIKARKGMLEGLSVPVKDSDLEPLHRILKNTHTDEGNFIQEISAYDANDGPIEFLTTQRLIILHGQPEQHSSEPKRI